MVFSFSYDECVGQGTQIYVPTDDPPPYSLTDPCQEHPAPHRHREVEDLLAGASWVSASGSSHYPTRLQDFRHQPITSISLSALPLDEAPPYEAVVSEQNQPLPLMPLHLLKHTTADSIPTGSCNLASPAHSYVTVSNQLWEGLYCVAGVFWVESWNWHLQEPTITSHFSRHRLCTSCFLWHSGSRHESTGLSTTFLCVTSPCLLLLV